MAFHLLKDHSFSPSPNFGSPTSASHWQKLTGSQRAREPRGGSSCPCTNRQMSRVIGPDYQGEKGSWYIKKVGSKMFGTALRKIPGKATATNKDC